MVTQNWNDCPLLDEYRKAKRAYLKELRVQVWLKNQRQELWEVIGIAFANVEEEKKDYWRRRLYSYYCRRFSGHTKTKWIEFLACFTDSMAYGRYKQEKAKRYCVLVRDAAREYEPVIGEPYEDTRRAG